MANRLAGIKAFYHRFYLSAFKTPLMSRSIGITGDLITIRADWLIAINARFHRLNLSALGTFFVNGKIMITGGHGTALANQLAGFAVTMNNFDFLANTAYVFHAITSFLKIR